MTSKVYKEYASKQYFFWNDKPYKVLYQSKRKNVVRAWDIKESKEVMLPWADWVKFRKKAYTTSGAAKILGRHHIRVRLWLTHGLMPKPFSLETIDGVKRDFGSTRVNFLWSEKDLHVAREYMESTGRKDAPSKYELAARINNDKAIRYIQDDDGEFIPIWVAE